MVAPEVRQLADQVAALQASQPFRAENLTISVPTYGPCYRDCPYCISKMTTPVKESLGLMTRNMRLVVAVAERSGVQSVLFTGKGEVLDSQNSANALTSLSAFVRNKFPLELQTSKCNLSREDAMMLAERIGLNLIAFSVDSIASLSQLENIGLPHAHERKLLTRLTFNMSDMLDPLTISDLIKFSQKNNVNQVTFRVLSVPQNPRNQNIAKWIDDHALSGTQVKDALHEALNALPAAALVRVMPDGAKIYDCDSLSVCFSEYCIQERTAGYNTRSLIFQSDGHLYTSWNSAATIIV